MTIFLTIVFSLLCTLTAQINHPDHKTDAGWIELQDQSSGIWVGYKEFSDITWCRTISTLPFKFNEISRMIEDKGNYYNIFDRVVESKEVGEDIVYMRINMPFPISDRDYLVQYAAEKDSSIYSYKFEAVEDIHFPEFSSCIRLDNAAGEWHIQRVNDSSTKVVYTWNGALGGSFPSYALTTAWGTQGNEMIVWLQESLEELHKE